MTMMEKLAPNRAIEESPRLQPDLHKAALTSATSPARSFPTNDNMYQRSIILIPSIVESDLLGILWQKITVV